MVAVTARRRLLTVVATPPVVAAPRVAATSPVAAVGVPVATIAVTKAAVTVETIAATTVAIAAVTAIAAVLRPGADVSSITVVRAIRMRAAGVGDGHRCGGAAYHHDSRDNTDTRREAQVRRAHSFLFRK